jgi:transposase
MEKSNLTKLQLFVKSFHDHPFYVGVDVHKRSYHVAIRRADGRILTFVTGASPEYLLRKLKDLGIYVAAIAYEAGPTGFGLARAIRNAGILPLVAAPSRIPRAILAGAKTDRLDCIRLADYAAKDLIKSIAIPTEAEEAERSLVRRRHKLLDRLRSCKQRIKSFLLQHGIQEPHSLKGWNKSAIGDLEQLEMRPEARMTLQSLIRELIFFEEEKQLMERCLDELSDRKEHVQAIKHMRSVPGVGRIVSATFRFELFNPERFRNPEEVASYLGLAPMVHHSGERSPAGHLRPVGQKRLRSLLVEAAWLWRAKDPYAARLYKRLLGRMGISQKAIAAVARKLAIILWRLSVEQRKYYCPIGA